MFFIACGVSKAESEKHKQMTDTTKQRIEDNISFEYRHNVVRKLKQTCKNKQLFILFDFIESTGNIDNNQSCKNTASITHGTENRGGGFRIKPESHNIQSDNYTECKEQSSKQISVRFFVSDKGIEYYCDKHYEIGGIADQLRY